MRNKIVKSTFSAALILAVVICLDRSLMSAKNQSASAGGASPACTSDNSGLSLPPGFCATVFADGIGHARDLVVAPNGVVYANTWSGRYYGNDTPPAGGFLVAMQDRDGSGTANVIERFGETVSAGGRGGTGIGIYKGAIYAEINDRIVRYSFSDSSSIVPRGPAETIVSGLPLGGDHPMHPFIITDDGTMYVDVASATNACQGQNRTPKSPGLNPCTELETRGGIWRYDANKSNQTFSPADRYAMGIRNAEGFAVDGHGRLFVTQHGRDQLYANWPDLYKPDQEATLPAEELLLLKRNGDYGWPECYYDGFIQRLVLAPEYGGDGGKAIGVCANKIAPIAVFPAHWAPNGMALYDKEQFPGHYRNGVFITFHGSWDRAPYPQGGYNVVFQALQGDRSPGNCEIFADGFAGEVKSPAEAQHRPSGVAVGPNGSLYVSDDIRGRIYQIVYRGGANFNAANVTACPSPTAPAGNIAQTSAQPPEGTHADAGATAARSLAIPAGATRGMVDLGQRVFEGQVGGAPCAGCHGDHGQGTPLGPPLMSKKWLWSDGSYAGIKKTIIDGVSQPKEYRSPMPPMGGAQLTPDQVSAVAAYVWSLSHQSSPEQH
jgi:glucose/arabinose dehydrogenase/mono/diheme cytochrome c family protein